MIEVRYAQVDADVVLIHRFLCLVAGPSLPGPINLNKSIEEVWRVINDDVALMALNDGILVGTMGIVHPTFWWGDVSFLATRWFFTLPQSHAGRALIREAKAIASAADLELHIISEERGSVTILNKSKLRNSMSTGHVLRRQQNLNDGRDVDQDPSRLASERGDGQP